MSFFYNFLLAILRIINGLLTLFMWIIIIRALISWVNPDPFNPIVRFLYSLTEPVLRPFRRLIPPWKTGGIDLSPLFAVLLIIFIQTAFLNPIEWSIIKSLRGYL